jgi:NADH:ubiquinone oxidoreductase subunit 5 (subunit L)/multisubunit Na+/H+ antiporter MnhA subunit
MASAMGVGMLRMLGVEPTEKLTARVVLGLCMASTVMVFVLAAVWVHGGEVSIDLRFGSLFHLPEGRVPHAGAHEALYQFEFAFLIDRLSVVMSLLTASLSMIVGRFSVRYLHRDPGFVRYFILLGIFVSGMQLLVFAGSYDLLFAGWEMVGVCSMLLIAFFQLRRGPVRAAVRAMLTYRIADVGLLVAGVLLHHFAGSSELADAYGSAPWPHAPTHLSSQASMWVAFALIIAAMGKSALFPLGTWLPRAMEGPTPSSALFYGALSVHAGVYLLLRSAALFEASRAASWVVGTVGLLTAITATMSGRTRSDVKSSLAYGTMTQIGLMLVGIGLHLWTWVLLLVVAHSFLRTLQLLRAPSALHDAEAIRAALAENPRPRGGLWAKLFSPAGLASIYHAAFEDFHLDDALRIWIIEPVLSASRLADRFERRWLVLMSGEVDAEPETQSPTEVVR